MVVAVVVVVVLVVVKDLQLWEGQKLLMSETVARLNEGVREGTS